MKFEWNNRQEINDAEIIKEIDNFFINSKYSGLEYRESQHKMALDIAHSILDGNHRVVEAGGIN